MEKEFVPYELALRMKALGYDEPCLALYINGKFHLIFSEHQLDTIALAPLFQQAFRWFRDEQGLKSWVQEHTISTFIYQIRPHILSHYKEGEIYVYKTFEEAELACLKKLIEIVEQTNAEMTDHGVYK